jgi:hypothetical protein
VNRWIATALYKCDEKLVRKCWEHTMDAAPSMLRVPTRAWELLRSFLPAEMQPLFEPEGTLTKARDVATAKHFVFPDKRRAKN